MKLFSQIVRVAVDVAKLPVDLAADAVCVMADAGDGDNPGKRVRARLKEIKEDAEED